MAKERTIVHVNSYFLTSKLHEELVLKLCMSGLNNQVFVAAKPGQAYHPEVTCKHGNGKIIVDTFLKGLSGIFWPLKMFRMWQRFNHYFAGQAVSLIHAHTLITNGIIAWLYHKKHGIPYVVTVRSSDIYVFMRKWPVFKLIARPVLREASAIITLSPSYRDIQLKSLFDASFYREIERKVVTIPNGINDFWLSNPGNIKKNHSPVSILFIGKLIPRKNLSALIQACQILASEGIPVYLDVVGDGPLLKRFKEGRYGFNVRFRGQITDRNDLIEIFRGNDIMVLPSLRETFGLVYPEAMSQGLPVIYTKDEGFDGFFKAGEVGFPVSPHDPKDIAKKVKMIIADYELFSERALKGSGLFSWDDVSAKIVALYDKVLTN